MAVDRVPVGVDVVDEVPDPALVVELVARLTLAAVREPDPQGLRVRKAVSRRRCINVSFDHSISSKISESGMNEIVVPVSVVSPITSTSVCATPRAKVWRWIFPSR